jgi:hypothetical protein
VGCSCMVGNMSKDICGSWAGTQNGCCGAGTEVGLREIIAMLDANVCVVNFFGCGCI